MTKKQFESVLDVQGGQFEFRTDRYEGMVGVSPSAVVIWVDYLNVNGHEPKYVGSYGSIRELLEAFYVEGQAFATAILPEISGLNLLITG